MWDIFKFISITVPCIIFGLIPEIVMIFVWNLVSPTTPFEKLVTVAIFAMAGTTLCIFFAVIAFMAWAAIVQEVF